MFDFWATTYAKIKQCNAREILSRSMVLWLRVTSKTTIAYCQKVDFPTSHWVLSGVHSFQIGFTWFYPFEPSQQVVHVDSHVYTAVLAASGIETLFPIALRWAPAKDRFFFGVSLVFNSRDIAYYITFCEVPISEDCCFVMEDIMGIFHSPKWWAKTLSFGCVTGWVESVESPRIYRKLGHEWTSAADHLGSQASRLVTRNMTKISRCLQW